MYTYYNDTKKHDEGAEQCLRIILKNIDDLNDSMKWIIVHFFKYEIFDTVHTQICRKLTYLFSKFINELALSYETSPKDFINKINTILVEIIKKNNFPLYDLTNKGLAYLKNILGNSYHNYINYTYLLEEHRDQLFSSWKNMFEDEITVERLKACDICRSVIVDGTLCFKQKTEDSKTLFVDLQVAVQDPPGGFKVMISQGQCGVQHGFFHHA